MRKLIVFFVIGYACLFSATVEQMKSEKRYAFVIANGTVSETRDDGVVRDALKLADFLTSKGFQTTTAYNLDRSELIKTFRTFDKEVEPNAVIAVVYAGRAIAYDAQTWMLPAGMKLEGLDQLRLAAVSLNFFMTKLQRHTPRITLGMIDGYPYTGKKNTTDADAVIRSFAANKESDLLVHWNNTPQASGIFPQLVQTVGSKTEGLEPVAEKLADSGVVSRVSKAGFYFNVPQQIMTPVDEGWARAVAKNSVVGYEAFLIAFPDSKYKQTAIDRIEALNGVRAETVANAAASQTLNASLAQEQELRQKAEALKKMEAELKAQQEALERLKAEQAALAMQTLPPEQQSESSAEYVEPAEMVTIPAGVYLMGSESFENAKPVHMVTVEKPFRMSAFEVGNKEYAAFLKATDTKYSKKKLLKNESAAVAYVSWEDANRYAEWLSRMTGKHYRLPTEAEWEYAARGGSDTMYAWGNNIALAPQYAWMAVNAHGFVHSRGLLQPNAYGLFDMAGNVAEWCIDAATPNYTGAPSISNRAVIDADAMKVIRGGSFKSSGEALSPSYRESNIPTFRSETVGFRLVESL